ncbi:MAG: hypothetical protein WA628_27505 [Terriglobales bacterium]
MRKHVISTFLAALLLAIPSWAQVGRAPMRISSSATFGSARHAPPPRALYLGSPFWADAYLPSYETPPSVIVVQAPPAERPSAKADDPKPATLLIEWQGDRYIRRTEAAETNSRATQPDYVAAKPQPIDKHSGAAVPPRPEPPPATFVFRDGHREESSNYSIISGVIYARGDYWTSGSWSKQIPLAQLDLPATFKANQEHGVTFRLPSGPNEIVTRP